MLVLGHALEGVDEVFQRHVLDRVGSHGHIDFMAGDLMAGAFLAFIDRRVDGDPRGPAREGPFALVELVHVFENADKGFLYDVLNVGFASGISPDDTPKNGQQGVVCLTLCIAVSLLASIEPIRL